MNLLSSLTWKEIMAFVGSVIAIAIGILDLWKFDKLSTTTDLLLIAAGLAALGISVAFANGSSVTPNVMK
jgi:NO-binding membrane sensor protein with MHYT domain